VINRNTVATPIKGSTEQVEPRSGFWLGCSNHFHQRFACFVRVLDFAQKIDARPFHAVVGLQAGPMSDQPQMSGCPRSLAFGDLGKHKPLRATDNSPETPWRPGSDFAQTRVTRLQIIVLLRRTIRIAARKRAQPEKPPWPRPFNHQGRKRRQATLRRPGRPRSHALGIQNLQNPDLDRPSPTAIYPTPPPLLPQPNKNKRIRSKNTHLAPSKQRTYHHQCRVTSVSVYSLDRVAPWIAEPPFS
jgi:hypothetical protein